MTYQAFVSGLLEALYPILLAVVTAASAALAKRLYAYLTARFSSQQLTLGRNIAEHAVEFVEQVYTDLHGQDKLTAALERAKAFGSQYGVNYTDQQWTTLLESAVHSFNGFWKEETPAS